jgi:putative glutamine amidotransferase
MRPLIGVTPDQGETTARPGRPSSPRYELKSSYAAALSMAGGLPLILPFASSDEEVNQYVRTVAGLVVTGGAFDIDPAEYGQPPHPKLGPLRVDRTRFERRLLEAALRRGIPVLGICGGMQLLNVVRGGSLIQDIGTECPQALDHEQKHDPREPGHPVQTEPGSFLAAICGSSLQVNSTHHQAVARLGSGLRVGGRAPDGIVEAIEDPSVRFVLGVEWHPELLEDAGNRAILNAFVAAASGK